MEFSKILFSLKFSRDCRQSQSRYRKKDLSLRKGFLRFSNNGASSIGNEVSFREVLTSVTSWASSLGSSSFPSSLGGRWSLVSCGGVIKEKASVVFFKGRGTSDTELMGHFPVKLNVCPCVHTVCISSHTRSMHGYFQL